MTENDDGRRFKIKKNINSSSVDFGNNRNGQDANKVPTSYMLKESQRLAAQQERKKQALNNSGQVPKENFAFNWRPQKSECYPKDNFYVPEPTIEDYHRKMMAGNSNMSQIKEREMAHGDHTMVGHMRHRYNEEKMKDTIENKQKNWEDPVIFKKRYNGYHPYTGYVDPEDAKYFRKRTYK